MPHPPATTLQPPATLLLGAPGSGKTDSLATLIASGLETFVLATEPDGVASLLDSCSRRGLSIEKLHWQTVLPAAPGWSALNDMVNNIATQGFEDLQKIKSGIGKTETRKPAMALLGAVANFRCERTGESFGDVTTWDASRTFVVDSLSGISLMAWALTVGYKPAAHQGEWGVAMNFIEQLLLKLTSDRRCFFVLTGHVEKELNEISGVQQIMASTLGRKLAPKIPRFFSEVVFAKRTVAQNAATFTWSTADMNIDLKNRVLPISPNLPPDFAPIVEGYRRRASLASESATTAQAVTPTVQQPTPQPPRVQAEPLTRAAGAR